MERTCKKCGTPKMLSEFWKRKCYKDGYSPNCKICSPQKASKDRWRTNNPTFSTIWARNNKESVKKSSLKSKLKLYYNMTLDQYYDLFEEQGNVCKICKTNPLTDRRLSVDHCHKTGIVRGLLCDRCNKALGQFEDNPVLLQAAIDYLINSTTNYIANLDKAR